MGLWKVWKPEGRWSPASSLRRETWPRAGQCLIQGHTAQGYSAQGHTAAFPPAGRVALREGNTCALLSTAGEASLGGVWTTQSSGVAYTDVSVFPDNRGHHLQASPRNLTVSRPLKGRKEGRRADLSKGGYKQLAKQLREGTHNPAPPQSLPLLAWFSD